MTNGRDAGAIHGNGVVRRTALFLGAARVRDKPVSLELPPCGRRTYVFWAWKHANRQTSRLARKQALWVNTVKVRTIQLTGPIPKAGRCPQACLPTRSIKASTSRSSFCTPSTALGHILATTRSARSYPVPTVGLHCLPSSLSRHRNRLLDRRRRRRRHHYYFSKCCSDQPGLLRSLRSRRHASPRRAPRPAFSAR